jgi:hypothetical protein
VTGSDRQIERVTRLAARIFDTPLRQGSFLAAFGFLGLCRSFPQAATVGVPIVGLRVFAIGGADASGFLGLGIGRGSALLALGLMLGSLKFRSASLS